MSDRFWRNVDKSGHRNGCWIWIGGSSHKFGYGGFWDSSKKRSVGAHRYSWEIHNGKIPDGQCVLHACDNPHCVNPEHLFLGTKSDNSKDRDGKKRNAYGERNGGAKLTEAQVIEIRKMLERGDRRVDIMRAFFLSKTQLTRIRTRQSWRHV